MGVLIWSWVKLLRYIAGIIESSDSEMIRFTDISSKAREEAKAVCEAYSLDSTSLLSKDIKEYIQAASDMLPPNIKSLIKRANALGLRSKSALEDVRKATKSSIKSLASKMEIDLEKLLPLWDELKALPKTQMRLFPQYMTPKERQLAMKGRLRATDLTLDLDTPAGRNAAAKQYMPMIYKIVNQYAGKSNLSRAELMSAALDGFTDAMNQWRKPDAAEDVKSVPFKTYASYRVKQQILNDMNTHGHSLSGGNWYNTKKYAGMLDAASLDVLLGWGEENAEGGSKAQDKLKSLGVEDPERSDMIELGSKEQKMWQDVYKALEKQFDTRTLDVFYRYFGLNGHKREKARDIARSMNYSDSVIRNMFVNKVLKWLKDAPELRDVMSDLRDIYSESLMIEMMAMESREARLDALASDDTFIILEDECRWGSGAALWADLSRVFMSMTSDSTAWIKEVLRFPEKEITKEDAEANKGALTTFFQFLYPASNVAAGEMVPELIKVRDAVQKFGIAGTIN